MQEELDDENNSDGADEDDYEVEYPNQRKSINIDSIK